MLKAETRTEILNQCPSIQTAKTHHPGSNHSSETSRLYPQFTQKISEDHAKNKPPNRDFTNWQFDRLLKNIAGIVKQ